MWIQAALALGRVVAFDPTDVEAAAELERLYRAHGRTNDLLELLRQRAERAPSDDEARAALLLRARTLREGGAASRQVIDAYLEVLDIAPDDNEALDAIEACLRSEGDWPGLIEHIGRRVDLALGTGTELDLRLEVAAVLDEKLGQPEEAIRVLDESLSRAPGHRGSLERLEAMVHREGVQRVVVDVLARVYRDADEWKKLIAVLEGKAQLLDLPEERAPVLEEIAELHRTRSGQSVLELEALDRLLADDPGRGEVLARARELAEQTGKWDMLARTLEHATGEGVPDELRETYLRELAEVHRTRRKDARGTAEALERVTALAPSDDGVLGELESLYLELRKFELVDDVLTRRAALATAPTEEAALENRRGRLWRDQLRDAKRAMECFERALRADDADGEALEALDQLYETAGEFEKRAEVLARRAALASGDERHRWTLERAGILIERLKRPDDAVVALEEILSEEPTHLGALRLLVDLYERLRRFPALVDAMERCAREEFEPDVRADLLARAAAVFETELGDPEEAVRQYQAALEVLDPHLDSVRELTRLALSPRTRALASLVVMPRLEGLARWDDLVSILEGLAGEESDPAVAAPLLRRVASIHEIERSSPVAAFEAYERAARLIPGEPDAVEGLVRTAAAEGAFARLVQALDEIAAMAEPPSLAASLWARAASIAEREVGDLARAVHFHARAEATGADVDAALREQDRLNVARGDLDALGVVLEKRVALAGSDAAGDAGAEHVDLLVRLATLEQGHRENPDEAVRLFAAALRLAPADSRSREALHGLLEVEGVAGAATVALEEAYAATAHWRELALLHERTASRAGERETRAAELSRAAEVWARVPDGARALTAHRSAWIQWPESDAMRSNFEGAVLEARYPEALRGAPEEALAVLGAGHGALNDVRMLGARWYRDAVGDRDAALPLVEAVVEAAEAGDPVRLDAHGMRADLLREMGRATAELAALREWSESTEDAESKLAVERRRAHVAVLLANDVAETKDAYRAILALAPRDRETLDALLALLESEEAWEESLPRFEQRIVLAEDESADVRVALRHRLGRALADGLGRARDAAQVFEAVVDDAPQDAVALANLVTLYRSLGDAPEVLRTLDRKLANAQGDVAECVRLHVARARVLREELHNPAAARAAIGEAAAVAPEDPTVLDELGRTLVASGELEPAVALFERRLVQARMKEDLALEVSVLHQLGAAARQLGSVSRARVAFERILALVPTDLPAARQLVELAREGGVSRDVVGALRRLVLAEQGEARIAAALDLAGLAESEGDAAATVDALFIAFETDPSRQETRDRLGKKLESARDFAGRVRLLRYESDHAQTPAESLAPLMEAARIATTELHDGALSLELLTQALERAPATRELLQALGDAYVLAGRPADAVGAYQQAIDTFGGKRSKELGLAYHRLGRAQAAAGNADAALAAYDAAFKYDLTSIPVLRDLGRLSYERGDYERAQKAFRALLLQRLDEHSLIRKADVYFVLGDIAAREGDNPRAISMAKKAVFEDRTHAEAADLLRRLTAGV
jgi:tetratricopeptide (TPR) repeat protein